MVLTTLLSGRTRRRQPAPAADDNASTRVTDRAVERFGADPDAPFLVSFPRTGSHWLRMVMELYFERPSLVRAFYFADRDDYLACHTHDMDLACERRRVIYLYRDPVDTVFSQVVYEKQSPTDEQAVTHWADRYAAHLAKWLVDERFTTEKTTLRYEQLRADLPGAFERITRFFGESLDRDRLERAAQRVTKDEVKRKTSHDEQVVQLKRDYEAERTRFRERFGPAVRRRVLDARLELTEAFGEG